MRVRGRVWLCECALCWSGSTTASASCMSVSVRCVGVLVRVRILYERMSASESACVGD